jgi:hypothetical protein
VAVLAAPRGQVQPKRGVRAADRQPLTGPPSGKRPGHQQVTPLVKAQVSKVNGPAEVNAPGDAPAAAHVTGGVGVAAAVHGRPAYGR